MRRAGRRLAVRIEMEYHLSFSRSASAPLGRVHLILRSLRPYESSSFDTPAGGDRTTRAYIRATYERNV